MKRSPLRRRNPERAAALRAAAFGRQAELCRRSPCCSCGAPPPSDPDHVRTRGAGGRDQDCVPLCRACHQERHAQGIRTFARFLRGRPRLVPLDLEAVARRLAAWLPALPSFPKRAAYRVPRGDLPF